MNDVETSFSPTRTKGYCTTFSSVLYKKGAQFPPQKYPGHRAIILAQFT